MALNMRWPFSDKAEEGLFLSYQGKGVTYN